MFNRKTDTEPAPFSTFKNDTLAPEWGTPAGSEMGGSPADIASEFLPVEPVTPFSNTSPAMADGTTHNVLNRDVTVVGTLRFTDDLLVDGSVEGEITSEGVLTVGANAVIQAGEKNKTAVRTQSAIIHGHVTGDVVVTDRVELAASAVLVGDITAAKLAIQEGATFVGHCTVGNIPDMPAANSTKRAAKRPAPVEETPNLLG